MSQTLELIGRYESTRFQFGDQIVGSVRLHPGCKDLAKQHGVVDPDSPVTVKGPAELTELHERSMYRFLGTFRDYTNPRRSSRDVERQFHFRTFVEHVPHDPDGLVQYLASNGKGNGIGPAKAKKLVEYFGTETVLGQCRENPSEVAKVTGIPPWQAEEFASLLRDKEATENVQIEIDKLLTGNGFPRTLTRRVIREWGNKASETIAADPYVLMQFKGVGFRLCDKLYMSLGLDPKAIRRQALSLWYSIAADMNGHCWYPATEMIPRLQSMIGAGCDYIAAIKYAKGEISEYGMVSTLRTDGHTGPIVDAGGTLWLAEYKVACQEEELASLVVDAQHEAKNSLITIYEDVERSETFPASVVQCARCGRALTADTVFVVNGLPYGPTCVEKIAT
ncbi:helix-hairpin-helix domain-containing protein [Pirellulaceae bacterium SH449]